jgi:formylglycine-generating enzyme required for sulfatase activity
VNIQSFALGKFEVTQGQWKAVMGSNPSRFKECGDNCPVEQVSWNDIQEYIQKLNQSSGKTYRLASEAEWEYAARAGSTGKWSFGDSESQLGDVRWYSANSGGKTQRVGQKRPNAFGLTTCTATCGNGCKTAGTATTVVRRRMGVPGRPTAGENTSRAPWRLLERHPANLRSANRFRYSPDSRIIYIGFRLARTVF